MENLTCELNGIKYLLIEIIILPKHEHKVLEKCKKYECIVQGVKEINTKTPYAILKVLVPETNVIDFNKEEIVKDNSNECQDIFSLFVKMYIETCCAIGLKIKSAFVSGGN